MSSNRIFIQEYLSSLKEDKELDFLFPILLNIMGYRIVQTAKESKGQSQYGKDIIAIGNDNNGIKHKWYFELKGFKDKNITDSNFYSKDGIRESILEAKYTAFNDSSIDEFNNLPEKIVLVHNGTIKANIRLTFEGFITQEFSKNEFQRWDIYHLTDLFSKHLFGEYLLLDDQSNLLFKKVIAYLDVPDNDFNDFKALIHLQFEKIGSIKSRAFKKIFATLKLLLTIIFHYSKSNKNLIPAKENSKFLILFTWSWVLKNGLENKRAIKNHITELLKIQHNIFKEYVEKTLPIAQIENGLYAENGAFFEQIGYPLRSFDYLDDLIYYFNLSRSNPKFNNDTRESLEIKKEQKDIIIKLLNNNSGFTRPLLDNHSIPIIQLFLFFGDDNIREQDTRIIGSYIFSIINNIRIYKLSYDILPELYSRKELVVTFFANNERPEEYCDSSSILLSVLLELTVVFDSKYMYNTLKSFIDKKTSLQIANIDFIKFNVEQLLFEKHMHNEYYVDCIHELPENFNDFKKTITPPENIKYRTDESGFSYLRYLAHSYFRNEILPNEWRSHINFNKNDVKKIVPSISEKT